MSASAVVGVQRARPSRTSSANCPPSARNPSVTRSRRTDPPDMCALRARRDVHDPQPQVVLGVGQAGDPGSVNRYGSGSPGCVPKATVSIRSSPNSARYNAIPASVVAAMNSRTRTNIGSSPNTRYIT